MPEKLESKDYRLIAICLVVCAGSLFVGMRYFYRAFPEASINFKVTRETSRLLAESFLREQNLPTAGYRHAAAFEFDNEAKVFLERELGLERTGELVGQDLKLWRWGHRWFRPLSREELRVEITPDGKLASFLHIIPEDAAGADLPPEEARAIAESFLVLRIARPFDDLEFIDSQSQKRPHRTDHLFTWKVTTLELRGATYRVTVTVQGDRVDGYGEHLRIPEEWSRSYARLRSLNEGATQVDLLFFALLGVAMLVTLGRRLRTGDVRWKTALVFAAIACVLQFLAALNEFPLAEYGFDTTGSYGSFTARLLVMAAFGAMSAAGFIFLLTAACEPLYREQYPAQLSITRMFTWGSIRTRRFFIASLVGITLTFFFFAFEIAFYLAANRFGAWSPAEIPYTDLLNTRLPWVFVLLGGFLPAVSEEWVFRAFSIPYLSRLLRSRWTAVVLASFIWGFGHANYPNQPFFIRGIEVGIVGIVLSWAMIRFGILAPLIAHYSIDAFYSAFLLLRSGNPYMVASGAATAGINLIPLLVAAGGYVVTRRFRSEVPVTNAAEGSSPPRPAESRQTGLPEPPPYRRLSRERILLAFALLGAGCLLLFFRPPRFSDFVQFRISAGQAADAARQFGRRLGFRVDEYTSSTQAVQRIDPQAVQYIYTAGGIERLNEFYRELMVPATWQTRFYRPLEKEELRVSLDPSGGAVVAFRHSLPEDASGAALPENEARDMASSFLRRQGYDLSRYKLTETRSEQQTRRRDHEFTWEALSGTPGAIGEARFRLQAAVLGNRIGAWTQYIRIPEEWKRSRERFGLYRISAVTLRSVFVIAMLSAAILVLVKSTRRGSVRWPLAWKVALGAMVLESLNRINSMPEYFFEYDTQVSPEVAFLSALVGAAVLVIGLGLACALAAGIIMACCPDSPTLLRRESRALWSRDAVIAALATLGLIMVLQWTSTRLAYHGSRVALAPGLSLPDNIGTYIPLLSGLRDVLFLALFSSAVLAFGVHLWRTLAQRPWARGIVIAGLLSSFLPPGANRISEVAAELILPVLLVAFLCVLVIAFYRANYLAYVFSAAFLAAARTSSSLLGQGNVMLELQGWILWGLVVAGMVVAILRAPPAQNQGPAG